MELSQLKMFKTVADMGSIIRASELLHTVPSNITTRIKLLEQELETQLFIRQGRGLVISPSGSVFLEYANQILCLCDEAHRAVNSNSPPSGELRVGAIESSATSRLPKILSEYHRKYPLVQLQFSTGTWSQLIKDIVELKLDVAIIAVDQEHPSIDRLKIYHEELMVIASASFGEITQPQDLMNKNIFMWPTGCPYRNALEQWLNANNVSAHITSIASYMTILGCVSAGSGVSLVPRSIYEQFKEIGGMKGYFFEALPLVQSYLIWNKKSQKHRAKDVFIDLFRS
ncbi:MAG: LysR family transcriptional regulator [Acinetobacter sp.]